MQGDTGLVIEQSSETLMIKINCKQQMLPHGGDKQFFSLKLHIWYHKHKIAELQQITNIIIVTRKSSTLNITVKKNNIFGSKYIYLLRSKWWE